MRKFDQRINSQEVHPATPNSAPAVC